MQLAVYVIATDLEVLLYDSVYTYAQLQLILAKNDHVPELRLEAVERWGPLRPLQPSQSRVRALTCERMTYLKAPNFPIRTWLK